MNSPTYRFTPAMFRAVTVDRCKTQTRRVVSPQPGSQFIHAVYSEFGWRTDDKPHWLFTDENAFESLSLNAPYGQPGTVKPVVTTWAAPSACDRTKPQDLSKEIRIWFDDGSPKPEWAGKSRPAMFFPRQLYALAPQARCVSVKAERLQYISESDAKAEGTGWMMCQRFEAFGDADWPEYPPSYRDAFFILWESINAERGKGERKGCYAWDKNPWVFATTFELVS